MRFNVFAQTALGAALAAGLLSSAPAVAQSIGIESYYGGSNLSYSGNFVSEVGDNRFAGRVMRMPTGERREITLDGAKIVSIARLDLGVLWFIAPQQRIYATFPIGMPELSGYLPMPARHTNATRILEAPEKVNGIDAQRYTVSGISELGTPYNGKAWFTREGALAKVDVAVKNFDAVRHYLTDIKFGAIDNSLFQLPEGYQRVSPSQALAVIAPLLGRSR